MTNPKRRDSDFLQQLTSFTATIGLLLLAAVLAQGIPNPIKTKIPPQIIAVLGVVTLALTKPALGLRQKFAQKAELYYTETAEGQEPSQPSRHDNSHYSY